MMRAIHHMTACALWALLWTLVSGVIPALAGDEFALSKGESVYVPIYSHVYTGNRELPYYLTATLSIRNTDPTTAITVFTADYYDSEGQLVERYIQSPVRIKPMATVRYIIKESEKKGGSGANFLVRWQADKAVNPALIQGVMIGAKGKQGISFVTNGRPIHDPSR